MSRLFVICFDIADETRLRRVSNQLENFGLRVQKSVFECHLDDNDLDKLKTRLQKLMNPEEDQVRYYALCPKDVPGIVVDGPGTVTRNEDYQIV